MPLKSIVMIVPLMLSAGAWAANTEHCPAPADIKQGAGIYSADAQAGKDRWLGVVQNEKAGRVAAFASATFYPALQGDPSLGVWGKCSYSTQGGDLLDLRYRSDQRPDVAVKLEKLANWKLQKGPFGISYYECTEATGAACAFAEVTAPSKR